LLFQLQPLATILRIITGLFILVKLRDCA